MSNTTKDFIRSIQTASKEKTSAYDSTATVKRIEGGTAWVHIPGGVDETPVKLTINAKAGDNVQVRVSGGNAFLVGNGSAPPTDDARANQAYTVATVAEGAAENALANAARAAEAADSAQASATRAESAAGDAVIAAGDAQTAAGNAQTAADTALVNLATTEDVVGVLNWITAHGTMTTQSGGVFVPGQVYFVLDDATPGDYHVGNHYYSVVPEPKAADIDSYYVLTVDESVQNYVATHIVVDSEGLWIIPDAGGNKVLIATGSGSTYTTAGTYIVGKVNNVDTVLASFTASGAQIGLSSAGNVVVDNDSVDIRDNSTVYATFGANGVTVGRDERGYSHISVENNGMKMLYNTDFYPYETRKTLDVSYGMTETGGYEGNYPYYELGVRKEADSINYSPNATYNVGATCRYDDKEYICNHKISTPEAWNRSHWNYITGAYSFLEGMSNIASGIDSHAEGNTTKAIGHVSHAEGSFSMSVGECSHAENSGVSYGDYSHAENYSTSNGDYSHAEGSGTANGDYSHAENYSTSNGDYSHAEGSGTANGDYSHAQNIGTKASSLAQTALGSWNVEDTAGTYAVIVGNGSSGTPSNALTVDWSGNVEAAGDVTDGAGNVLSSIAAHAVISTGSTGGWNYKKYADGTFEATRFSTSGATGAMTQVGSTGIYYSSAAEITFPSIGITGITSCLASVMPSQNYLMSYYMSRLTTSHVYFSYIRYGSATAVTGISYGISITGTYS